MSMAAPRLTAPSRRRYDACVKSAGTTPARSPRCPRCATPVAWTGNPHRPFCSLTCRLIDLGVWLDERYRVAGESLPGESGPEDRVPTGGG
jgi:uncharacterized protein